MRKINTLIAIILTFALNMGFANGQKKSMFFSIRIQKEINSSAWREVKKGFEKAEEIKPEAIIIHMNTYGGEVLYADSIRTKIINYKSPVYVFIDNNAASAGALISIACDRIYMRKGANIGAATVVNQTGEQMPDKYQSYMRGIIRSTAESHGKDTTINGKDTTYQWKRDPLIAEAMVDDRVAIAGIIDSGKVLTFTTDDAIKYKYCEGTAETIEELISEKLNSPNYELITYEPTVTDMLVGFLTGSILRGILIMVIIGGIYFELQTPGLGFPTAAAIIAAVLYFAPLYLDGLAANWEILIFVVGLILIALEVFVIPGFGIAGISGIILVFSGLVLSMLGNNDFNFESVQTSNINRAIITVMSSLIASSALIIYLSSRIGTKGMFRNVALNTEETLEDGYIGVPTQQREIIGQDGIAFTDLRPSGKVQVNETIYDAMSEEGYIEKGTMIRVNKYETGQVYVSKLN